jgi:hypothetical protein
MNMKKVYINPQSTEISFQTEGLIATSPGSLGVNNGGSISREDEFLSNKKNPIWDNENEGKDIYW